MKPRGIKKRKNLMQGANESTIKRRADARPLQLIILCPGIIHVQQCCSVKTEDWGFVTPSIVVPILDRGSCAFSPFPGSYGFLHMAACG